MPAYLEIYVGELPVFKNPLISVQDKINQIFNMRLTISLVRQKISQNVMFSLTLIKIGIKKSKIVHLKLTFIIEP